MMSLDRLQITTFMMEKLSWDFNPSLSLALSSPYDL